MSQNLQLDPTKKDYVFVNGSPVASDRVLEAAYYALLIPKGKWLYGTANQGSLIYTLNKAKRDSSIEQHFTAYATDAINKQLIDPKLATAVQITNIDTSRTGSSNEIDIVPNTTQVSNNFNFISVG